MFKIVHFLLAGDYSCACWLVSFITEKFTLTLFATADHWLKLRWHVLFLRSESGLFLIIPLGFFESLLQIAAGEG